MTMLLFIVTMAVIAMEAVRSQCLENANCDLGYYCDESYLCQQCIYCKNDIITRTCHKSIADCEFSSWNTSTTILTEGKENYNGSTRYIAIIVIAGVVAIILIGVFIFYRTVGKRFFLDRRVCQEMMLSPTAPPPYNLTSPLDEQYSICNNNSEISPLNKVNAESMEDARRQSANFQRANPFQPPYYIRKPPTPSNEPSNPSNANAHVNANAQEASGNNHSTVNDESSSPSNGFVYLDEETRASTWMPGDNNNNVNDESSSPSNGFVYLDEETRASTWMPGDNNNNVNHNVVPESQPNGTEALVSNLGQVSFQGVLANTQESNNNHIAVGNNSVVPMDVNESEEGREENPQSHSRQDHTPLLLVNVYNTFNYNENR